MSTSIEVPQLLDIVLLPYTGTILVLPKLKFIYLAFLLVTNACDKSDLLTVFSSLT